MNRDDGPQLKIFQRMRKQKPLSASAQTQKPVTPSAQNPAAAGKAGDLSWTLDARGVLTIAGAGVVDGFTGTPWTPDNVTSLVIRDGVTGVGLLAFYGHKNLTSVRVPDSVTQIGGCAFQDCAALERVELPTR